MYLKCFMPHLLKTCNFTLKIKSMLLLLLLLLHLLLLFVIWVNVLDKGIAQYASSPSPLLLLLTSKHLHCRLGLICTIGLWDEFLDIGCSGNVHNDLLHHIWDIPSFFLCKCNFYKC